MSYLWSSFGAYLAAPEHRLAWIRVDRLLGEHGITADTAAGREETDPEALRALRRGWWLGSDEFKRQQLMRMERGLGEHHAGELHRASAEAKAERIVAEELKRRGWREKDLVGRRKNDPSKLELATRLRRETTLTLRAIAARVHLGSSNAAERQPAPLPAPG